MQVAGVLLGGGDSTRFGSPKLETELDGVRLIDLACRNFLEAGLEPVVFVGQLRPAAPEVIVVEPGAQMIETLRNGLAVFPDVPFAFAPADMPALEPALVKGLRDAFLQAGCGYLVPVHGDRRGHPAFAWDKEAFLRLGDGAGAREVWQEAGDDLVHHEVSTADVLFDVDTPEDLAAAGAPETRLQRLIARGDIVS